MLSVTHMSELVELLVQLVRLVVAVFVPVRTFEVMEVCCGGGGG